MIIEGSLAFKEGRRDFRQRIGLLPNNRARNLNLSPGYEDGYSARGRYRRNGATRFTASFPFVVRTTEGQLDMEVRLVQRNGRRRLVVVETLTANTLTSPLVWRFRARTR